MSFWKQSDLDTRGRPVRYARASDISFDPNTVLLCKFDGENNSTVFKDSSKNNYTITPFGDAKISTAQAKFGQSALFDGTGDYLTVPNSSSWAFGTGNFTIDLWARFNSWGGTLLTHGIDGSDRWTFYTLTAGGTRLIYLQIFEDSGVVVDVNAILSVDLGVWYHCALVRNGTDWRIYQNGISVASATSSYTIPAYTGDLTIASHITQVNYFNGYMDELRISKGIARWTADFTPPTKAYRN